MDRSANRFLHVLLFSAFACGETVSAPPRFTISGTVVDSVTGTPVEAALVSASEEVVTTDTAGEFQLPVDSGMVELLISHQRFEDITATLQLVESRWSEFGLRRTAPYVRDHISIVPWSSDEQGLESALVADLQGSTDVNSTRGELQLWFMDLPFTRLLGHEEEDVEWVVTDSLTVQVLVWLAPGLSRRDSLIWTLFDVDGHMARWRCLPTEIEPQCVERFEP